MPRTRNNLRPFVESHILELARPANRYLVRSLVMGRKLCGGDLDKLLVLGIVLVRMNDHPDYPMLRSEDMIEGSLGSLPSLPVTVQSIADIASIPRESVRRKVKELSDAGWIERINSGHLIRLTHKGYTEIHPLRDNLVSLVTDCVVAVDQLLTRKATTRTGAA